MKAETTPAAEIAQIISEHEHYEFITACSCEQWHDASPDMDARADSYARHVADAILASPRLRIESTARGAR